MEDREIQSVVEAVLFVSGEPICKQDLANALEIPLHELEFALFKMQNNMEKERRGLCLQIHGEHIQLSTRAECAPYIEKLLQPIQKQALSQSALETLSLIAYRQPITRLDIENVRGVKSDYSVQVLIKKGMIEDVGRKDVVGRPILYATTDKFLSHFGLTSLSDLPRVKELDEMEENEKEVLIP